MTKETFPEPNNEEAPEEEHFDPTETDAINKELEELFGESEKGAETTSEEKPDVEEGEELSTTEKLREIAVNVRDQHKEALFKRLEQDDMYPDLPHGRMMNELRGELASASIDRKMELIRMLRSLVSDPDPVDQELRERLAEAQREVVSDIAENLEEQHPAEMKALRARYGDLTEFYPRIQGAVESCADEDETQALLKEFITNEEKFYGLVVDDEAEGEAEHGAEPSEEVGPEKEDAGGEEAEIATESPESAAATGDELRPSIEYKLHQAGIRDKEKLNTKDGRSRLEVAHDLLYKQSLKDVVALRREVLHLEQALLDREQLPNGIRESFEDRSKRELRKAYKEKYAEFQQVRHEYIRESAYRKIKSDMHAAKESVQESLGLRAEQKMEFLGTFFRKLSEINIGKKLPRGLESNIQLLEEKLKNKDLSSQKRAEFEQAKKKTERKLFWKNLAVRNFSLRSGIYYGLMGLGVFTGGLTTGAARIGSGIASGFGLHYGLRSGALKKKTKIDAEAIEKMSAMELEEKMHELSVGYALMGRQPTMYDKDYALVVNAYKEKTEEAEKDGEWQKKWQELAARDDEVKERMSKYKKWAAGRAFASFGLAAFVGSGLLSRMFGGGEATPEMQEELADTTGMSIGELEQLSEQAPDSPIVVMPDSGLFEPDVAPDADIAIGEAAVAGGEIAGDALTETIESGESVSKALFDMVDEGAISDDQLQEAIANPRSAEALNMHLVHAGDRVVFHPSVDGEAPWIEVVDFEGDSVQMGGARELADIYMQKGKPIPGWLQRELEELGIDPDAYGAPDQLPDTDAIVEEAVESVEDLELPEVEPEMVDSTHVEPDAAALIGEDHPPAYSTHEGAPDSDVRVLDAPDVPIAEGGADIDADTSVDMDAESGPDIFADDGIYATEWEMRQRLELPRILYKKFEEVKVGEFTEVFTLQNYREGKIEELLADKGWDFGWYWSDDDHREVAIEKLVRFSDFLRDQMESGGQKRESIRFFVRNSIISPER